MEDGDIDIYADLEDFDLNEKLQKIERDNFELQERLRACEQDKINTEKRVTFLKKEFDTVNRNIVNLLQTAKNEIQRKDNQIQSLRKELDNVRFRRDRRTQNERNGQLRNAITQTDWAIDPHMQQENQLNIDAQRKFQRHEENDRRQTRNPFSSNRKELLNGNKHIENNDDLNEKSDRSHHRHDVRRGKHEHQRKPERSNPDRIKRNRSRSNSRDRKRQRRSHSQQKEHTNRHNGKSTPDRTIQKEVHRTDGKKSDKRKRSPENISKADLRQMIEKKHVETDVQHESSKGKRDHIKVEPHDNHSHNALNLEDNMKLVENDQKPAKIELIVKSESAPSTVVIQNDDNLEDGEIIDENSMSTPLKHFKTDSSQTINCEPISKPIIKPEPNDIEVKEASKPQTEIKPVVELIKDEKCEIQTIKKTLQIEIPKSKSVIEDSIEPIKMDKIRYRRSERRSERNTVEKMPVRENIETVVKASQPATDVKPMKEVNVVGKTCKEIPKKKLNPVPNGVVIPKKEIPANNANLVKVNTGNVEKLILKPIKNDPSLDENSANINQAPIIVKRPAKKYLNKSSDENLDEELHFALEPKIVKEEAPNNKLVDSNCDAKLIDKPIPIKNDPSLDKSPAKMNQAPNMVKRPAKKYSNKSSGENLDENMHALNTTEPKLVTNISKEETADNSLVNLNYDAKSKEILIPRKTDPSPTVESTNITQVPVDDKHSEKKILNESIVGQTSDETMLNTSLNSSTPKLVKNISTKSTDYRIVEDDNNDVIIYVTRKKRKKKKSLQNSE